MPSQDRLFRLTLFHIGQPLAGFTQLPWLSACGRSARSLGRVGGSAQGTCENGALRRTFTVAIKSFNGGPSSNQMEDANTKGAGKSPVRSPRAVQPDRGRVKLSSFS